MNNINLNNHLSSKIIDLLKLGDYENAAKEYSVENNVTIEDSLKFIEEYNKNANKNFNSEEVIDNKRVENIFSKISPNPENSNAVFPQWDVIPPDQIINPRLK